MKENKLFSAMSNIDEELVSEALNAPQKRKLPVLKFTASAAALIFIALSAAVIVNISRQNDIIAEPDTSETAKNIQSETKVKNEESLNSQPKAETSVSSSEQPKESIPELHTGKNEKAKESTPEIQTSKTEPQDVQVSTDFNEQLTESIPEPHTSETEQSGIQVITDFNEHSAEILSEPQESELTQTQVSIEEDDEFCKLLAFVVRNGKTYTQVFGNTEYTLDEDIGCASDFEGSYYGLYNDSKVYTVKDDERILIVKSGDGSTVTLMLRDESLQDRFGYYFFNGLRVDPSLYAALNSNDGKAYSIYATRPDSDDMYDYVYNGKTLRQMKEELEESWKTSDGKNNPFYDEYQKALDAFLKEKIRNIYNILTENGIKAELINEVRCEMTITKEQFENFASANSNLDEYAFGILSGGYFTDDENA